jgi:hypothetical protein
MREAQAAVPAMAFFQRPPLNGSGHESGKAKKKPQR